LGKAARKRSLTLSPFGDSRGGKGGQARARPYTCGEPARTRNRACLTRKIAWRLQAMAGGGQGRRHSRTNGPSWMAGPLGLRLSAGPRGRQVLAGAGRPPKAAPSQRSPGGAVQGSDRVPLVHRRSRHNVWARRASILPGSSSGGSRLRPHSDRPFRPVGEDVRSIAAFPRAGREPCPGEAAKAGTGTCSAVDLRRDESPFSRAARAWGCESGDRPKQPTGYRL